LVSVFALGGLVGCSSGEEETREDEQVAEQQQNGGVVGKTERAAQKTEATAKDLGEQTHVAAERAEDQVKTWIGGGPPQSDTQAKIDEVEREIANYRKGIEEQGYKLDSVMGMRIQQVEERVDLLKMQYQSLAEEANLGIAEIDANFEGVAEDIEDDWDDIEDQLEVELGRSYEKMDSD
jgi:exonuclease VII large subunit